MSTNKDKDLKQLQVEISQLNSTVDQLQVQASNNAPPAQPASQCQCPVAHQCGTCPSHSPFVPDFAIPLLAPGGGDCNPDILAKLGPLAGLIGTWVSSKTNGYNVMPIPQATGPHGFILKNFPYYEVTTFSAYSGPQNLDSHLRW